MQNIISKDPRRKDVDISMIQWMMIGQADYCMANSVRSTIFAMTAFVAGPCKFIPVIPLSNGEDASMCTINNTITPKDSLFTENPRLKNLNPEIDEEKRKVVWGSVIQEEKLVENQECFRLPHKPGSLPEALPSVLSYWVESGRPRINETALNETLALKAAQEKLKDATYLGMDERFIANTTFSTKEGLDPTFDGGNENNTAISSNITSAVFITPSPTPKKVFDKMALDNFQIDNWNPTAAPTIKPSPMPTMPYTFKKMSASDRMTFKNHLGA